MGLPCGIGGTGAGRNCRGVLGSLLFPVLSLGVNAPQECRRLCARGWGKMELEPLRKEKEKYSDY